MTEAVIPMTVSVKVVLEKFDSTSGEVIETLETEVLEREVQDGDD